MSTSGGTSGGGNATELQGVPVSAGTPSDLQVLQFSASGDQWEAETLVPNVSGIPFTSAIEIDGLSGSPDRLPASPSTFNDEFNEGSAGIPTGWTTLGTPTSIDTDTVVSNVHIVSENSASVALVGMYKAIPAFPFTVTAKMTDNNMHTINNTCGLFVGEAVPGNMYSVALDAVGGTPSVLADIEGAHWTSPSVFAAAIGTAVTNQAPAIYLRIVATSTSAIQLQWSRNGIAYYNVGTSVNPGLTIGSVGLFANSQAASTFDSFFDWIRFN